MLNIVLNLNYFSFLLFGSLNLNAKTDVIIKGQVTDGKNGPALPFATISVMNKSNKVLTGNTTDNNGIFEIKLNDNQISAIKISFIGYKDTLVSIPENTTSTINLGSLFINKDSKTLQAAVVTSKIPIIEQKIDKIVMNVSEAVFVQNKTGFEVLKRWWCN
ncbi:MAG: carboxypeptidase-like regulatory domain-containing protein [Bacteroidales bacterium]